MWAPTYRYDYLCHHGILGMKWGKRNGPPYPLNKNDYSTAEKYYSSNTIEFTSSSPREIQKNGDYLYKKGTVAGRIGVDNNWGSKKDITYLYTNKKDRSFYMNRFGKEDEIRYIFKKNTKMPNLKKQYLDLLEFVRNNESIKDQYDYAKNEPFDFWKDYINQGGSIANQYYSYMKNKGYGALIDFRNVGLADDPIIILSPNETLKEVKEKKDDVET